MTEAFAGYTTGRAGLELEGNVLVYRSVFNRGLVDALKAAIPSSDRQWDRDRKVWLVAPPHADTLAQLSRQYLGETVEVPAAWTPALTETRTIDVRYIGRTKNRGGDERTAFGWSGGEWSVVFPEPVLRAWFKAEMKPEEAPTLYAVLGIDRQAPGSEIKKAYRRLAMEWHPDVSSEPDAQEQFIRIKNAYDVLGDQGKRLRYDVGLQLEAMLRPGDNGALETYIFTKEYRSPLRCGLITGEGIEQVGRFVVSRIVGWQDIKDDLGRTLVVSWPPGAETFEETYV